MKTLWSTVLIFSIFIMSIWSSSLFAGISSRIEGTVTDKDTGDPIHKAWVLLYRLEKGIIKTTQTDIKGCYRFEGPPVFPGKQYYIRCTAPGYAQYIPEYYFDSVKPGYFDEIFQPFLLAEGQIKHVKINLEKGGSLKGKLFIKEDTGISPFKNVTVFLRKKKKPNEYFLMDPNEKERFHVADTETNESGEFTFLELEPSDDSITDEYVIQLDKFGYSLPKIQGIIVKKGMENKLDYTVDMSNQPGLRGIITINGEPPLSGGVILYSLFPDDKGVYNTIIGNMDKEGNYFFWGISPGKFRLDISCYYLYNGNKKRILKNSILEIFDKQTKELNFNLDIKE